MDLLTVFLIGLGTFIVALIIFLVAVGLAFIFLDVPIIRTERIWEGE